MVVSIAGVGVGKTAARPAASTVWGETHGAKRSMRDDGSAGWTGAEALNGRPII